MSRPDAKTSPADRCGTDAPGEFLVEEHGSDVVVFGTLPDFDPNDLVLEVRDGALRVDALHVPDGRRYSATVALPSGVPPGPVGFATFVNGVLEVRLPRTPAPTR
jgi:HSP20 family molecular chaperone IbpA